MLSIEVFLGSGAFAPCSINTTTSDLGFYRLRDLPLTLAYVFVPGFPSPGAHSFLRRSFCFNDHSEGWNFNQLSIGYAFQPRLRSRLTLGG